MKSHLQNSIVRCMKQHKRFLSNTTHIVLKEENLPAPAYRPDIVEKKKYDLWEKRGHFVAGNDSGKICFSMILPPPNITGKLHLGHALACTIQDVISRKKRAEGCNVLWLPGTDHAGIATQGVVEKYLKSTQNIDRQNIGREKFVQHVWNWKEKYRNNICDQLRALGCSLDWSRQVFTMDPRHSDAVNAAFTVLFNRGLIYRKKTLVNWCNKLKSTVSDIEVENINIKKPTELFVPSYDHPVKFGLLYSFAYKVFDSTEEIVVSTTMPETMMGDMAVAVHSNDERYTHLVGKRVFHPFRRTTIPIIADNFVDMAFGTGAVKITPAHSKVDYNIGKNHKIPMLQIINEDGLMINSDQFNKMNQYECRDVIVRILNEQGLLRDIKEHEMTLPLCSRTGDVIQYLPKEQWFLSCGELNRKVVDYVKSGQLKISPERFQKTWLQWADDDRDWCISRQLWWGHQIPAYKCSVGNGKDIVWVATSNAKKAKNEASKYLRALPADVHAERDSDVLDTWFSSAIYPFAALGWPENIFKGDYGDFYPLSLMATAHDILGFWVHRMAMLGLELTGSLPFEELLLHGVICDNKGSKMSKSKGNVIDPIDVINGISLEKLKEKVEEMHKHGVLSAKEKDMALSYHKSNYTNTKGIPECGVDALRFTLLSQDVKSHFVSFDVHQCNANKLFCNKIWQSLKYTQRSFDKLRKTQNNITLNDLTFFDKWILSRLSDMVDNVNKSMENYNFHLATRDIRRFLHNEFCDVYLESTKPGFEDKDVKVGYAHAHTLSSVLNISLRCLAPFMVYLTAELIPKIPSFDTSIIYNFKDADKACLDFPPYECLREFRNEHIEKEASKLLGAINLIREIKGLYGISNKYRPSVSVKTEDGNLKSHIVGNERVVMNLTRCGSLFFDLPNNTNYVKANLDNVTEIGVEVIGENIDATISAARTTIEKKIKKLEDSLNKLEDKFSSHDYLHSVPEWTKVLDRERLMVKKEELKNLQKLIVD